MIVAPAGPQLELPLPRGSQAIVGRSGVTEYRRANWQGSQVIDSTTSQTASIDAAFTPYGEHYAENGYLGFFGGNLSIYPFFMDGYAATWRLYHYDQGRWISPDPAGLSAVDPSNPQTWNRYAYVAGNPLGNVDPSGLLAYCPYGVNYNTSPPSCLPPPTSPCYSAATGAAPPGCGGGAPANSGYGAPGGQGGTAGGGRTAPNNTGHVVGCLAKGVAVGAIGALAVGAAVVVAAPALGISAAAASTALFVAGVAGGVATGVSAYNKYQSGNYSAAAFDVGSLGGGLAAGGLTGGKVGDAINTPATRGFWSLSRDIGNLFNPSKGWNLGNFMATGPDAAAAAGATGAAGSSGSLLAGLLGCGG